ncbi:outer membrane beta-barrel protein [Phenylobacterium sp.]|uniref:outer membrane beta-barrel protein n=1 Tax=Phenylobacterium sp. TaxID=1871053 RepID=UPI0035B3BA96
MSVTQRPRPGYQALGIHAGSFFIYPKLTADVAHEDNIFYENTNEKSDTIYSLRPSVELQSNWSRHMVHAFAQADIYKFDKYSDQDNTTWEVGASSRIDVVRGAYIRLSGGYQDLVEARYSPTVQQYSSNPLEYKRTYGTIGGSREVNRLRMSGELTYSDYNYNDTSVGLTQIDLGYRDRQTTDVNMRVDYAVSPALAVYVYGAYNKRDYAHTTLINDVDRTSDGWEGAVGADFEVTDLTRGQLQVGYLSEKYDDPRVNDVTGLALRGRLEWFPTQLTTVTFTAERSIEDTGVLGAAGTLTSKASAQIDHELLRNLILTGRLNWQRDEYRGLDRDDDYSAAMLGVNYLLNRKVGVFAQYNYQTRDSSGLQRGVEYNANRIQVGVVLQY